MPAGRLVSVAPVTMCDFLLVIFFFFFVPRSLTRLFNNYYWKRLLLSKHIRVIIIFHIKLSFLIYCLRYYIRNEDLRVMVESNCWTIRSQRSLNQFNCIPFIYDSRNPNMVSTGSNTVYWNSHTIDFLKVFAIMLINYHYNYKLLKHID